MKRYAFTSARSEICFSGTFFIPGQTPTRAPVARASDPDTDVPRAKNIALAALCGVGTLHGSTSCHGAMANRVARLVSRMLGAGSKESVRGWECFRKPFTQSVKLPGSGLRTGILLEVNQPTSPAMGSIDPTQVMQIILMGVGDALDARSNVGVGTPFDTYWLPK